MPAPNVDIVFVVDASASMTPCFDKLRRNLGALVRSMEGYVSRIHFGLVAHSAWGDSCQHTFLCGSDHEDLLRLYQSNIPYEVLREMYFTENSEHFCALLERIETCGNEDSLVALDIALDFPFGHLAQTKRVIALFSDEPFETGNVCEEHNRFIPELVQKIHDRRVLLYCAVPDGPGIRELSKADGSEVTIVEDGNSGLEKINFQVLLTQMGQSISRSLLQAGEERDYKRALFGQNAWPASRTTKLHIY